MQSPNAEQLRQFFKLLNRFMVFLFRAGLGSMLNRSPRLLGRYMVLVHRGRKSGMRRYTPVNYMRVGEDLYCVAGFGHTADWYRNLIKTPDCEIWLPEGAYHAIADETDEDRLTHVRGVLASSGFAASLFGGIDPFTISDTDLEAATREYRLMRFALGERRPDYADLRWATLGAGAALVFVLALLFRQGARQR